MKRWLLVALARSGLAEPVCWFQAYFWASSLGGVVSAARILKAHFEGIVTYSRHPIHYAISESLNARIQLSGVTAEP